MPERQLLRQWTLCAEAGDSQHIEGEIEVEGEYCARLHDPEYIQPDPTTTHDRFTHLPD